MQATSETVRQVLRSWLATEVLTPQATRNGWNGLASEKGGQQRNRAGTSEDDPGLWAQPGEDDPPPWPIKLGSAEPSDDQSVAAEVNGEGKPRRPRPWYLVILGALPAKDAFVRLDAAFADEADDDETNRQTRGQIIAASAVVDEWGVLVPDTLSIASFAWGLGHMVSGGAASELAEWDGHEQELKTRFGSILTPTTEGGIPRSLTWRDLRAVSSELAPDARRAARVVGGDSLRDPDHEGERAARGNPVQLFTARLGASAARCGSSARRCGRLSGRRSTSPVLERSSGPWTIVVSAAASAVSAGALARPRTASADLAAASGGQRHCSRPRSHRYLRGEWSPWHRQNHPAPRHRCPRSGIAGRAACGIGGSGGRAIRARSDGLCCRCGEQQQCRGGERHPTLADRVSPIEAGFHAPDGGTGQPERVTGIPLLVHRRCEQPMFSLANRIAYDGRMVFATPEGASAIRDVLGSSAWIDVDAPSTDKWVETEGRLIASALTMLCRRLPQAPDVYVISPFRMSAIRLRAMLLDTPGLLPRLSQTDRRDWIERRVGARLIASGRLLARTSGTCWCYRPHSLC